MRVTVSMVTFMMLVVVSMANEFYKVGREAPTATTILKTDNGHIGSRIDTSSPHGPASRCLTPRSNSSDLPKFGLKDLLVAVFQGIFYLAKDDQNRLYNYHYLFGPNDKYGNWDKGSLLTGIAKKLANKLVLDKKNNWDMYQGWYPSAAECKENDLHVRKLDGTCNDEKLNAMGSVGTRFGRNIIPGDQEKTRQLLVPNPRLVSRKFLAKKEGSETKVHKHLNLLMSAWVQFIVHDFGRHEISNSDKEVFKIPLDEDDPLASYGRHMYVSKTEKDSSRIEGLESSLPKTFKNLATQWLDADQLYGNSEDVADSLRTFRQGMMQLESSGILPIGNDNLPKAGFTDNWWIGLELIHNLFVREHNSIASMLSDKYPNWNDQKIYDTARMINIGLSIKIHFTEFITAINNNKLIKIATKIDVGGVFDLFTVNTKKVFNILAPLLPEVTKQFFFGFLGGQKELSKSSLNGSDLPHSASEELMSLYRVHSLVPDSVNLYKLDNCSAVIDQGKTYIKDTIGRKSHQFFVNNSLTDLLLSFGLNNAPRLTLNNYPDFFQHLETGNGTFIDLGTIDILRDRERELPLYNRFREKIQLQKFTSLSDLTDDAGVIETLEEVYGKENTIDKVDLLVGVLAEKYPACSGFSETFADILLLEHTSYFLSDRFFNKDFTAAIYSKEGLEWIKGNTMKDVLLRHAPELNFTGLKDVDNAFFFWG